MPWSAFPLPPLDAELSSVGERLDAILEPMGFAAAQAGSSGAQAQVIFCRGFEGSSDDGCIDLVIDLEQSGDWHVVDVRYWGFTSDRWHLVFDRDAALPDQLAGLARTLPDQLR